MPFALTMPKLSPTMEEGFIAKWHKKEGEYVAAGELLLEISTDKATIEHNALDEGWLRKILVQEGASASINQPIALFTETESESIEGFEVQPRAAAATEPPKEEKIEIEAPKEKEAGPPTSPPLAQPAFVPEPPLSTPPSPPTSRGGEIVASPLAKRLAKERGLDLASVQGSGPGGRITSRDLEKAQPSGLVSFTPRPSAEIPAGTYEEIPLSPLRKTIAKRLQESKSFVPHFYVKQTIDAEPLFNLREQLKNFNLKVTFNDMIIKGCALALRQHPEVNSGFNSVHQTIIQFKTIDIAVAVTVNGGLITPIIRHADTKNMGEISVEVKELAERARSLKLQEHEYKGGSFCISNLGMFGITEFSAVINPPQSAILAVGGIEERAVVKEGKVAPGKTLVLTLSCDHRVIDGSCGAQFLKTVQKILENPVALTL